MKIKTKYNAGESVIIIYENKIRRTEIETIFIEIRSDGLDDSIIYDTGLVNGKLEHQIFKKLTDIPVKE